MHINFFTSFFHRGSTGSKQDISRNVLRVVRAHAVLFGVCGLLLLLVAVLVFDGIVFYTNVMGEREYALETEKKINLSEQGIADVLRLMRDRQKKFDGVLNNLGSVASATSSLPATR